MRRSSLLPNRCPLAVLALAWTMLAASAVAADPPAKAAAPAPMGTLDTKDWLKASTEPLKTGEIDRLIGAHLAKAGVKPAPIVSDERFVRRVYLDLTGRLPTPADIKQFLKDQRPDRRIRLIDKLLASDAYAEHWAVYWRNVIANKVTDFKGLFGLRGFDVWMTAQLKDNRSWGDITRRILLAGGKIDLDEPEKNGEAFFVASRFGMDSPVELAAETSRIFLGIQIQCAQCHDHPSDVWKRKQFHEFAAYFARTRERPIFDREKKRFTGVQQMSLPFAEHRMPGKDDKTGTVVHPAFLDGKGPGVRLGDFQRRKALANAIIARDNPWFAAAFVNRMWGLFMGQSFYQPIDDLGPMKEAVMPDVIARIAGAFRGNGYDIKQLFRDMLNSEAYQREVRQGQSPEEHVLFAGRTSRAHGRGDAVQRAHRHARRVPGATVREGARRTIRPARGFRRPGQADVRLRSIRQGRGDRGEHEPGAAADEQPAGGESDSRARRQFAGPHAQGTREGCRGPGGGVSAHARSPADRERDGALREAHPGGRQPGGGIRRYSLGAD